MATELFTTAGTGSWVCPAGVNIVQVEAWGGGGKGGTRTTNGGGGGGGGGAYASGSVIVVPGTTYYYRVGNGGTSTLGNGGQTVFTSSVGDIIRAVGGNSVANNTATGGTGGLAVNCVGTFVWSGGNGATGVASTYGGGGGESAGPTGGGTSATGFAGGSGSGFSGDGGNGPRGVQGAGSAGTAPGSGGGGGLRTASGTQTGANGTDGWLLLTYTPKNAMIISLYEDEY